MNQQTDQQLTKRSFKAGFWLSGYKGFSQGLSFFKTIITARILTPEQFGIFGVVSIGLNLFETFSETGIEQALIHRKHVTPSDVTSAWVIMILRSLVITLGLIIFAPWIAHFFNQPTVVPYIRVIALTPLLRSLRNPQIIFFKRNVDFKMESYMLSFGAICEVISGIVITLMTRSVWGLVLSITIGGIGELIASFILVQRPKWVKPNWQATKELFHFGKWVWGASALSYVVNQGDDIFIGKFMGATPLGFYLNAFKLASLPATHVTAIISQVTFPAFSVIKEDIPRLKRAFKKSLLFTAALTIPISVVTFVFATPLTLLLFGQQWLPIIPALRVLCIFGAVRAFGNILAPLANALGRPDLITVNGIIRGIVLFALIFPLAKAGGLVGVSWSTTIAITVANTVLIFQLRKQINKLSLANHA